MRGKGEGTISGIGDETERCLVAKELGGEKGEWSIQLQLMVKGLERRRITCGYRVVFLQHKEYAGLARGNAPGGGGSTDLQESCT